ncbi:MAG: acetyl-CoA carboxylase biotin carboxyl carrier protein [Candidatus Omnitrophica bacterium]|nr:acetyl-CoA carboxylase biotin carboxyl carrier protein [Candidatus Omnitrophota bacterium]
MNLKEIKEMIQLMNEHGLSEFEMEKEGLKIRLKKGAGGVIESTVSSGASLPFAASAAKEAGSSRESSKPPQARVTINSPMVGTFYSAPAPDAPPFVQISSDIKVGQVVCIIEAMKLMNEIKAEVRGKIVEILVNNGDPVEFGQPLFVIE